MVLDLFLELGLLLNLDKSTLVPTQTIEFVGTILDSRSQRASLPDSCFLMLKVEVKSLQSFPMTIAQTCMCLLGLMATCTYVVQHARLHMRPLQMWLARVHRPITHSWDRVLTVPMSVLLASGLAKRRSIQESRSPDQLRHSGL